jgi:hypothetical protein
LVIELPHDNQKVENDVGKGCLANSAFAKQNGVLSLLEDSAYQLLSLPFTPSE